MLDILKAYKGGTDVIQRSHFIGCWCRSPGSSAIASC